MKSHITYPGLVLLGVALLMAGCHAIDDEPPQSALSVLDGGVLINDPEWAASPDSDEPPDSPVVRERQRQQSAFMGELGSQVHYSQTWQEAHRAAVRMIDREPAPEWASLGRSYREQVVAAYMLRLEQLRLSTTSEATETLAFYTDLLITNQNRTIELIVDALKLLEDRLPEDQHTALVAQALELARGELARVTDCTDCPMERLRESRPELFGAPPVTREVELAIAIEELEQMAGRAVR